MFITLSKALLFIANYLIERREFKFSHTIPIGLTLNKETWREDGGNNIKASALPVK